MIGPESREAQERVRCMRLTRFLWCGVGANGDLNLLSLKPQLVLHDAPTNGPAVNFGWAVVNAEAADFTEYPLDRRVGRQSTAAQNLHRPVGDAKDRFRANDFGDRAF